MVRGARSHSSRVDWSSPSHLSCLFDIRSLLDECKTIEQKHRDWEGKEGWEGHLLA